MKGKALIIILLTTLASGIWNGLSGQPIESSVNGKAGISLNDVVVVYDNKYYLINANPTSPGFHDSNLENLVSLEIDHGLLNYVATYDIDVKLTVKSTYLSGGSWLVESQDITLNISHNPNDPVQTKEKAYYKVPLNMGYKVEAQVIGIYDHGTTHSYGTSVANLRLETEIRCKRDYGYSNFSLPAVQSIGGVYSNTDNTLSLYWSHVPGYFAYDLEWAYIDNSDGIGGAVAANKLYYKFKGNSSRIRLTSTSYEIPLVMGKGYIIYRVRGIREDQNDNVYGPWSLEDNFDENHPMAKKLNYILTAQNGSLDLINYYNGSAAFLITNSHQPNMNWQQVSSFAEGGKRKDVVSYYDGSMRNRQTVTLLSSKEKLVAAETIYDFQGRPAVQVLPSVINTRKINYQGAMSRNTSGAPYTAWDFDVDASGGCSSLPSAGEMSTNYGASNYYSNSNNSLEGYNAFLPEANGFPFVVTEYTPDNTGRIRSQGGVGETHQLDQGHATTYLYSSPTQEEIDRLFGSEVGYAEHYKKNTVIDPNGQVSISYLDPAGRVIATALTGSEVGNLLTLDNRSSHVVESDYIAYNNLIDDKLIVEKEITVTENQMKYEFSYTLTPDNFAALCGEDEFDINGHYRVDMYLYDECGVNKLGGATVINKLVSYPDAFSTGNQSYVEVILDKGTYKLVKILSVDEDYLMDEWENYLENSNCLKTLEDFTASQVVDIEGCSIDCQECLEDLGSLTEFEGTEAEYNAALLECKELCDDYISPCESQLNLLMNDVSPGGQYGSTDGTDPHSVFYSPTNKWKNPTYKDRNGNNIYVEISNDYPSVTNTSEIISMSGKKYTNPKNIANLSDFLDLWDDEWARSLASQHPEYCYINWCMSNDVVFDSTLFLTETYLDAVNAQFLNPGSYDSWTDASKTMILDGDPYFNSTTGQGYTQETSMKDYITKYSTISGTTYDIYQVASASVFCPNYYNAITSTLSSDCINKFGKDDNTHEQNDAMWNIVKHAYSGKKANMQIIQGITSSNCTSMAIPASKKRVIKPSSVGAAGATDVISQTSNQALPIIYQQYHMCPIAMDLMYFINDKLSNYSWNSNSSYSLNQDQTLTKLLYDDLNSTYSVGTIQQEYTLGFSQVSTGIKMSFYNNTQSQLSEAASVIFRGINLDQSSSIKLSQIKSITKFRKIVSSSVMNYNFIADILYDDDNYSATPSIGLTLQMSSTGIDLNSCNNMASYCQLNQVGDDLRSLLDGIINTSTFISSNPIQLSLNYGDPSFVGSDLRAAVDPTLNYAYWTWLSTSTASSTTWTLSGSLNSSSTTPSSVISLSMPGFSLDPNYNYSISNFEQTSGTNGTNGTTFDITFLGTPSPPPGQTVTYTFSGIISAFSIGNNSVQQAIPISISDCGHQATCQGNLERNGAAILKLLNNMSSQNILVAGTSITPSPSLIPSSLIEHFGTSDISLNIAPVNNTLNITFNNSNTVLGTIEIEVESQSSQSTQSTQSTQYNWSSVTGFASLSHASGNDVSLSYLRAMALVGNGYDEVIISTSIPALPCISCEGASLVDENFGYSRYPYLMQGSSGLTINTTHGQLFPGNNYWDTTNIPQTSSQSVFDPSMDNRRNLMLAGVGVNSNKNIWFKDDINVETHTFYIYEFDFMSSTTVSSIDMIIASINSTTNPINQQISLISKGLWSTYRVRWYSGSNISVNIAISSGRETNLTGVISLDNIRFYKEGCAQSDGPMIELPTFTYENDCEDEMNFLADFNAYLLYQQYLDSAYNSFSTSYVYELLMGANEELMVKHTEAEFHHTLYYYDQAGNLRRTVPPKGVTPVEADEYTKVKADRNDAKMAGDRTLFTSHTMASTYEYNSLNQLVKQKTPDGGMSSFWYDALGRLVVSQNAQQATNHKYSFTRYDELGRVYEVGEIMSSTAMTTTISMSSQLHTWIKSGDTSQITTTWYDVPNLVQSSFSGTNLRGRVAQVGIDMDGNGKYEHVTKYSYDIHGNVMELQNVNDYLYSQNTANARLLTHVAYDYDLVSGNVKQVNYQQGSKDQFMHRYHYDSDNRITHVFTSTNGDFWEHDARYDYYDHGPLARTEIGDDIVQGIDNAYTIHGWIKGVNSENATPENDMGKDGKQNDGTTGSYKTASPNLHGYIPADKFGYTLNFYQGDYQQAGTWAASFVRPKNQITSLPTHAANLYNGNISHMVTTVTETSGKLVPQLAAYRYDQLNRIMQMMTTQANENNEWVTDLGQKYFCNYSYDPNGNILYLSRTDQNGQSMDKLSYTYNDATNNRLHRVVDALGTAQGDDFGGSSSYKYDAIGNLVYDSGEEIESIEWTVSGKVRKVIRMAGSIKPNLEFYYDAMGNRVGKKVINDITKPREFQLTWYSRDASGNVMATYQSPKKEYSGSQLKLIDISIYGSSRLGVLSVDQKLADLPEPGAPIKTLEKGNKHFELVNHLGNVLSVISDRLFSTQSTTLGKVARYTADLVSSSDYFPFGMQMPGRKSSTGEYRYGFNGKEKDQEGMGGGGSTYDYGFRIYNAQIAKFLSVDPLSASYPWYTPYQFAGNDPIRNIDIDGLEGGSAIEFMFGEIASDVEGAWNYSNKVVEDWWNSWSILPDETPNKTASPINTKASQAAIKVIPASKILKQSSEVQKVALEKNIDISEKVKYVSQFTLERPEVACARASQKILKDFGIKNAGQKLNRIIVGKENAEHNKIEPTSKASEGIGYIDNQLESGNPVMVGLNHTFNKGQSDGQPSDHYVVIVGRSYDEEKKKYYYNFYEVGTRDESNGKSDKNRLYINDDNTITGTNYAGKKQFEVTEVRRN